MVGKLLNLSVPEYLHPRVVMRTGLRTLSSLFEWHLALGNATLPVLLIPLCFLGFPVSCLQVLKL